ncbi:hypothetical protein PFICI_05339 [Pestalotiopsis fici W106-1]|uniref:Heterokaryon incompatibility domain-containing protein n=1 Tax=Pestalotiopsis fici (strain W106-1 / CGMCC3.15140) TaxID=1229662 RepID=W3XBK1_PESFW|nr:uncharacterized protein PFICI_05339 [Pestalotiopsis fici W106-1]ETS83463.1 hypothetical protein PFICI_05339 [Pestalotiopsis fici W106-1]
MPELAIVRGYDSHADTAPAVNFIVVPGIAGATLGDKTCPHVDDFLATMITNCNSRARGWVYDNDIVLNTLESWDKYSSNGFDLLRQLLCMQDKPGFALFEAWNEAHRPDQKRLLDKIETVMMIGEPILDPRKRDQWIGSISECFANKRTLPPHLADGATVGSLHRIANDFEDIYLNSTVVDVDSTALKPRTKLFKIKKTEHDGCICPKTVHVRMWTTASKEQLVEKGIGDISQCGFDPSSAHYQSLLSFNSKSILPTSPTGDEEVMHARSPVPKDEYGPVTPGCRDQYGESPSIPVMAQGSGEVQVQECEQDASNVSFVQSTTELKQPSEICLISARSSNDDAEKHIVTSEPGEMTADSPEEIRPVVLSAADDSTISQNRGRRERRYKFSTWLPPRDKHFTGRSDILQQITEQMPAIVSDGTSSRQLHPSCPKSVWLEGPGGIGKTSIAIEFAHRSVDRVSNIIYCDASSAALWGSSCHDSAVALGLVDGRTSQNHETSRQMLMSWLEASSETWMLILDNVTNDADFIRRLPSSAQGLIIVTSRLPPLHSIEALALCNIRIPSWSQLEAEEFMFRAARRKQKELDVEELRESARRCRGVPLVLRQVANWYRRDQVSLKTVNRLLASAESRLLIEHGANNSLFLTAAISNLDARQTRLLGSLSFLKPDRISKRLAGVCSYLPKDDAGYGDSIAATSRQLWKLSLLDMDETETNFRMHSSTQSKIRSDMDETAWNDLFLAVSAGLDSQWPSQRKFKNIIHGFWDDFQSLHDHTHHLAECMIEKGVQNVGSPMIEPSIEFASLLLKHTWYNGRRGNEKEDKTLHNLATILCHCQPSKRSSTKEVSLPRRCLEIPKTPDKPIVLRDTEGTYGTYVACSLLGQKCHSAIQELSSKSIQHYREGLDVSKLPENLLQAIHIARGNNIPYVWVDRLCIRQDDPKELSEEVPRLVEYFSNSSITVYDAKDSIVSPMLTFHSKHHKPATRNWLRELIVAEVGSEAAEIETAAQPLENHKLDEILPGISSTEEHVPEKSVTTESTEKIPRSSPEQEDTVPRRESPRSSVMPKNDTNHIIKGWDLLEDGKSHLIAGSMNEAVGSLTLSRDAFRINGALSYDELDGYANASALLSTTFRLLKLDAVALDLVRNATSLCGEFVDLHTFKHHGYGLLLLSEAMALYSSAQVEQAQERLNESRAIFDFVGNEPTEWTASIDVQLASCHAALGEYREAHELLQSSMTYFQAQPMSPAIEGHLARILFRQSQLYEKENNIIMHSAFTAAASSAFAKLRPLFRENSSPANGLNTHKELSDTDFDALVEPWYR